MANLGKLVAARSGIALLAALACAHAQTTNDYRLQADDVVHVAVFGEAQVNNDVPIGKDGNCSFPFVGQLHAAGKSVPDVTEELVKLYRTALKLKNPRVALTISKYRSQRATINGFVTKPGIYEFRQGDTVASLISQGGGPITDHADLRHATLRHTGSPELIPVDLYSMLIKGDMSQNMTLEDGDEINVPEDRLNRILVMGALQKPGVYPYKEPMMLSDAIALAGGEVRYRSYFSHTFVLRPVPGHPGEYKKILTDYVAFVRKGDSSQNVELQPGDVVFVPETKTPDLQQLATVIDSLVLLRGFRF